MNVNHSRWKGRLAALLALCLTLSLLPVTASAAGEAVTVDGVEGGQLFFDPAAGTITDCDTSVTVANIPGEINGTAVTSIGDYAFQNCANLTSVAIPDSVTSIGVLAFGGCTSLTSAAIPGQVTSIENGTFNGCTGLASVAIPDGVTSIGNSAFMNCSSLTGVTLPDSVASIGGSAFSGCSGLTVLYYWGSSAEWEAIAKGTGNDALAGAAVWHPGTAVLTYSDPVLSAEGVTLTITSDRPFNPAVFAARAFPAAVSVNVGTTGLTPASASLDAADATNQTLNLSFTGASQGGDVSVTLDSTAFAGPENFTSADFRTMAFPAAPVTSGSLTITKALSGGGGEAQNKTYSFTVTGPGGYSRTVTVTGAGSTTLNGLTPGTYTAAEDQAGAAISGYTLSVSGSGSAVTVAAGGAASVTITNTYTTASSGGGGSRPSSRPVTTVDSTLKTEEGPEIVISGTGESELQDIVKDGEFVRWIDRVELPSYARKLYDVLALGRDNDALYDVLIRDVYNTVSGKEGAAGKAQVESVLTLVSELDRPLSPSGDVFRTQHFTESSFDTVDTAAGDRSVDYASLKEGDVVRTATFNGVYATKIRKDGNPGYDEDVKKACGYVSTAFQAFDRDHPEIFWLSGKSKVRMVTVSITENGSTRKESYIFFTLADKEGFSVRDAACSAQSEIEAQIARRDAAVSGILSTVTSAGLHDKIRDLNRWLTEHNQYNTSADLTAIGNAPHECLSALVGSAGTTGPVCDGYARAFKVLCDRLDIPCVLVDGYARVSAESKGEFHMWNSVQMPDSLWYGVDVTWNDPSMAGSVGPKSGRENERFLLAGADTVVLGMKFADSHPPVNRAVNGGVAFINGPTLSMEAFNPMAALPFLPFTDVSAGDWFLDAVQFVYEEQLMNGVTETRFDPQSGVTRAMLATVLHRLEGKPESAGGAPFSDVAADMWCASAVRWARDRGVLSGYGDGRFGPGDPITREQLVVMLWRYAGSPAPGKGLEGFTDSASAGGYAREAMSWAAETGILSGSGGALLPKNGATRAQTAAVLQRFCRQYGT